jgi:chemotaxis response regulator CheB
MKLGKEGSCNESSRQEPVFPDSLVVIAASAGGLPAMQEVLGSLPADFPGAIAIVQHRADYYPDLLPELLGGRTLLPVCHATDGAVLEAGHVYVCPPGMHMTTRATIQLVRGPRRKFVRPSADWMFDSAACTYGDRAIGIVLSGTGSDGAAGAKAILDAGGHVIAQDPSTCEHSGMPAAALMVESVACVPLARIGETIARLVGDKQRERSSKACDAAAAYGARRRTVLLADDHRMVLDGLRALLRVEPDLEVVAQAETGRAAVQLAGQFSPDVVVMDVGMPDMNGIEATRMIKTSNPRTAVVALSARGDYETASRILEAGATGYVAKEGAYAELATAIRTVADQREYVSPRLVGFIKRRRQGNEQAGSERPLSPSEREIIQLTAEGKTAEQIGSFLGFSKRFVEARLARTMKQLGIVNIAGLTRYAIREGLTFLES